MHNTQEIKTIDFDDLDFLSQDNIKKKKTDLDIFSCVKSTTPRYHSSFYRVLLSVVVRHFCVSVILFARNRRFGGISFCPVLLSMSEIGTGASVFHKRILFVLKSFCIRHFNFFNFAVWVRVCKLYDFILYILDWTEEWLSILFELCRSYILQTNLVWVYFSRLFYMHTSRAKM